MRWQMPAARRDRADLVWDSHPMGVFTISVLTRTASAVLILALSGGCAVNRIEVMPMWYRNAPKDWVPPATFATHLIPGGCPADFVYALQLGQCCIRDEVVLVNGTPNGLDTIRIECKGRTVLVDKVTKRIVWETYW
jgi:hypothetical protein